MSARLSPPPAAPARTLSQLPGPPGLPLLGNALQLRRGQLHHVLEGWAREYGPLYQWRIPRGRMLTVADHKVVAALLRDRPAGFDRPVRLGQISEEMGLPGGVFRANGDAWQRQRRMVMSGLDPAHVKAYMPALNRVANRLLARWQKAADANASIDVQGDLMRYTVDTIAGLALGAEVKTLETDGQVIQDHLDKILPAVRRRSTAMVPYWRWVKLEADRNVERSIAEVMAAIHGFIGQARARLDASPHLRERPSNLLESMIVASEAEGGMRDREVAGNVLTMLLAGEDTTANSIAWMIDLLVRHPATLERARDELRSVLPGDGTIAFDTQALGRLSYVDACIQEALRLKPVAPFIPLEAKTAMTIEGVAIPAGTLVFCLLRHDTVREGQFPDAASFRPERWLDEGTAPGRQVSTPFGAGARICPGRYLALLEMKIAMAVLLGRFEIESLVTPDGGPPAEVLHFTMAPVGLAMKLRRAQAQPVNDFTEMACQS